LVSATNTPATAAVIAENGRRAVLKRLFRVGTPDIMSLLQRKDLPGLVEALQDKSPDVVSKAAEAITSLHRQGDEAERRQGAGTAPALIDAYDRVCGPGGWLFNNRKRVAAYALIEALGEIRAAGARERLMWVVSDKAYDKVDRGVAMEALARIFGTAMGPWFVSLLDDPDRAQAASFALVELGEEGLQLLREYLLRPDRLAASRPRGDAGNALEKTVAAGGTHAAAAQAILAEADTAEHEAERQRAEEREALAVLRQAEEREAETKRRQHEELAAKLAGRIGSSQWVVPGGTIEPGPKHDQYERALERCRRLGFPVREYEESESNEIGRFWAEVGFEGEVFTIDGGRGFRDVM
jgi:hypothetical protein